MIIPGRRKAQASIEFIVLISVLLIIASAVVVAFWPAKNEAYSDRIRSAASSTLREAVFHLNSAQKIGDGYVSRLTLPERLLGSNYNITIEQNFVSLAWTASEGHTIILPTIANGTVGGFQKGLNTIRNVGGTVYVN